MFSVNILKKSKHFAPSDGTNVVLHRSMQGSYCRANASQYLTATWVPYVDNGTGTTGVPQNSIKNHHDGNNPSTQQSTQKTICNLTTWESNVLLVGKDEEGAKMPKNGASMWCRAWHQVVECSNERSVTCDTSRKKITHGSTKDNTVAEKDLIPRRNIQHALVLVPKN
jgi:hypothetical protein